MYVTIQASRAVAAILVVLFHLGGTLALDKYFGQTLFAKAFSFGHAGVEFFFVLSGFIITYVHWNDFGNLRKLLIYAKKRAVRIYPIYWVVFLIVSGGAYAYPGLRDAIPTDPLLLIKSLALVPQDKLAVGGTGAPVLIVAWSLQYELLFYSVMALFIASVRLGLFAVLCLAVFSMLNWKTSVFPATFIANEWLFLFGMGALVGAFSRTKRTVASPKAWAALGVAVFFGAAAFEVFFAGKEVEALRWVYGSGSAIAILGLVQMEDRGMAKDWNHPWLLKLGDASYALYLIHFPLISLLCKVAMKIGLNGLTGTVLTFVSVFLLCLLSAVLLNNAVEKPLLIRLSGKSSRPAPTFSH